MIADAPAKAIVQSVKDLQRLKAFGCAEPD
jgi:hypothetical protein